MSKIEVITGDITQLEVDAIVNAANKAMCGGGGVDGAIHRAAGPKLVAECRAMGGCDTGRAKITGGYNLHAKYVIHAVGPVWHGGDKNEKHLLASCYFESLNLAKENGVKTIAFPAISCGAYRFPIEKACKIAVNSIKSWLNQNGEVELVYLVCFESKLERQYLKFLNEADEVGVSHT